MKQNKFSIIIPVYNAEKYISKSIQSVQNQTYSNYELILIDDCSTDRSVSQIQNFQNLTLLENTEKLYAGGSRNRGILAATGDYILFLDADDCLASCDVLEKLNAIISGKSPDIVYTGFQTTGSREITFLPDKENCTKEFRLAKNKYINVCSEVWNRNFLLQNQILFPVGTFYEDVIFTFLGIEKSTSYEIANFVSHIYVSGREGSTTTKYQFRQPLDTVKCIENLCLLKQIVSPENLPFLEARIKEQRERLVIRLDRVLRQEGFDV